MSENNKDELTGPYNTLSVIERTKVLGLVPATSPGEKRKPPLPSSPKPLISLRGPHLSQERNASKTNGAKSRLPPPVVPYRERKRSLKSNSPSHSPSSPVHSPSFTQCPVSPDAFKPKSPPPFVQHRTSVSPPPSSPPVAASSYEEPVLSERLPTGNPPNLSDHNVYSEVDTDTVMNIIGLNQFDEYSTAKCRSSDPSVAPPPPVSGNTYESLSRGEKIEKVGQVPVPYEEAALQNNDAATTTGSSTNVKKVDAKVKRPPLPKMKPALPATKPQHTPPKPKRTYTTNLQQPENDNVDAPSNPVSSTVDDRLSKPMPLPRVKPEEEKVPAVDNNRVVGTERSLSQDVTSSKEADKVNPGPVAYCYIDIDIPNSPSEIVSAEQLLPTTTVSKSQSSKFVPTSTPDEVDTATVVKQVPPPSPKVADKPKRRAPPPPPAGAKPKSKSVQTGNQPNSNFVRPPNAPNKPKFTQGHPNTLPDPTPAKPMPQKKWFHLVTKRPGSNSPVNEKKPVSSTVAKDAGNTPPSSKRRDSKRKKFFQRNRHSLDNGSSAAPAVDKKSNKPRTSSSMEDQPDSPPRFGYATVTAATTTTTAAAGGNRSDSPPGFGYAVVGPNQGNEKKFTAANFKGGGDMTPHSKQRVLAAYAEVDINQKMKWNAYRPLSSSQSDEFLDKLLPQSTKSNESGADKFVVSPYGTLPRQRYKSTQSRSALPIYAEVQKPNQELDEIQAPSEQTQQRDRIFAEIEESTGRRIRPVIHSSLISSDTMLMPSDLPEADQPPVVPPQTEDSLKFDSPAPEVPPQTADSLRFDSSSTFDNENDVPVIVAYATVEAKDVVVAPKVKVNAKEIEIVVRKPSKEEITAKTKSLGRSLKPKNKPAPLPPYSGPHRAPRSKKVLSRVHSVEVPSSDSDADKTAKAEHKDKGKKEPLYESVDDLDLKIKSKLLPGAAEGSKEAKFLSKDKDFLLVGKPSTCSTASNDNDDSDDSTDWDSYEEEDEEQEEQVNQKRGKTYHIAKELLTTERTFVKGLTLLDKNFRQTVLSANRAHERPVLPEDTLNAILSNVGSLCILNSGLLSELEDRLEKWDSNPKIGDVLMNTAPFFKLYTEYISNFDKALKLLEDSCKKNRAFGELVKEFEGQPICAHLPLSGYLLETVQRIPRYKLLLQDYLKHLPEDSEDRLNSERSLELISKVAAHVNESIRQVDNFKKLLDVQKKLVGDVGDSLVSPSRKLLREGEMLKYSRKEIQPRMFFLFTDILIYASAVPPANTMYKVVKRIPLHGMKVSELDDPEVKHGLQIISTCKSFRLGTNTLEEKVQWMKALEDALFEHEAMLQSRERYRAMSIDPGRLLDNPSESLGILAPPWLPDNCVSMCMMCKVRFNLTKRRHHCRACGNIFCAACSSYLAALKYQDNKMDRVCQTCYEKLTGKGGQQSSGDYVTGKKLRQSVKMKVAKARSAVLEVKARKRSCEISGYLQMKDKRWRKQWLEVAEFALYVFEKHEDVSAKRSISLPGYLVIYPLPDTNDKTQLCITHPGTGSIFFKTESEDVATKWVEVFQNAVKLKSVSDND